MYQRHANPTHSPVMINPKHSSSNSKSNRGLIVLFCVVVVALVYFGFFAEEKIALKEHETVVQEHRGQADQVKSQLQNKIREIQTTKGQLETQTKKAIDLRTSNKALQDEIASHKMTISENSLTINEFQDRFEKQKAQIAELQQDIEAEKRETRRLQQLEEQFAREKVGLEDQLTSCQENPKIQQVQQEKLGLKKENDDLHEKYRACHDKLINIQSTLEIPKNDKGQVGTDDLNEQKASLNPPVELPSASKKYNQPQPHQSRGNLPGEGDAKVNNPLEQPPHADDKSSSGDDNQFPDMVVEESDEDDDDDKGQNDNFNYFDIEKREGDDGDDDEVSTETSSGSKSYEDSDDPLRVVGGNGPPAGIIPNGDSDDDSDLNDKDKSSYNDEIDTSSSVEQSSEFRDDDDGLGDDGSGSDDDSLSDDDSGRMDEKDADNDLLALGGGDRDLVDGGGHV